MLRGNDWIVRLWPESAAPAGGPQGGLLARSRRSRLWPARGARDPLWTLGRGSLSQPLAPLQSIQQHAGLLLLLLKMSGMLRAIALRNPAKDPDRLEGERESARGGPGDVGE